MSARPLDGKVVVDLTTALSGPYATLLLAGLGARVIKVENPATGGDSSRQNSPYLTDSGLNMRRTAPADMSISMVLRGRNKESVTLDLKAPAARDVLADLVKHADILVENYSAGVTTRLGIDYEWARAVNPRIVYASISGFGSEGGPGSGKAMDTIIQALSGVMLTAGGPGEPPTRFGLPIADLVAPLYGSSAPSRRSSRSSTPAPASTSTCRCSAPSPRCWRASRSTRSRWSACRCGRGSSSRAWRRSGCSRPRTAGSRSARRSTTSPRGSCAPWTAPTSSTMRASPPETDASSTPTHSTRSSSSGAHGIPSTRPSPRSLLTGHRRPRSSTRPARSATPRFSLAARSFG